MSLLTAWYVTKWIFTYMIMVSSRRNGIYPYHCNWSNLYYLKEWKKGTYAFRLHAVLFAYDLEEEKRKNEQRFQDYDKRQWIIAEFIVNTVHGLKYIMHDQTENILCKTWTISKWHYKKLAGNTRSKSCLVATNFEKNFYRKMESFHFALPKFYLKKRNRLLRGFETANNNIVYIQ